MNFFSKGEDPPNQEDIEYYGLLNSCQRTHGEFALYSDSFAARGRIGTTPLYWNVDTLRDFSFTPSEFSPDDFPPGHLYDFSSDRLICWDHMYYDKPQSCPGSRYRVPNLLTQVIGELEPKVDAILFGPEDKEGTVLIMDYCCENLPVVTDTDAKYLSENTKYRKFMCSIGYSDLFEDGKKDRKLYPIVKEFAKYGLELYSPFCDFRLVDYVMDMTLPEERKNLLQIVEDEIV